MTRVFTEAGAAVPVTVLEAGPCSVLQTKSDDSDGYSSVQIGFGAKKHKRASKAELGARPQGGT